jgi:hypothetical protein
MKVLDLFFTVTPLNFTVNEVLMLLGNMVPVKLTGNFGARRPDVIRK